MVPQIARRHFLALPLGLLLVPRPSVAATSTRKDFTFRVDVGVLFDLLTFTVAGALVEEVDVQAGRYRVAFSGEGSGITNRTEATGIIRAGRFMPVETKSTGTVRGRENRVDVRYDYERGRVEYHSVGHTLLLGRRRQVDDDGRAEALPLAVVLADRRPHARVREAGVDQDPVRERDRVRRMRGRARPGRERVRHKRAEARKIN